MLKMKANNVGNDKAIRMKSKVLQFDLKYVLMPNSLNFTINSTMNNPVIELSINESKNLLFEDISKPLMNIITAFSNINIKMNLSFRNSLLIMIKLNKFVYLKLLHFLAFLRGAVYSGLVLVYWVLKVVNFCENAKGF